MPKRLSSVRETVVRSCCSCRRQTADLHALASVATTAMNQSRLSLFLIVWCLFGITLCAAEPKTELLWPEGAPGALGKEAKDEPKLIAYLADSDKANGAAIVICPGGGYGHLAMGHEGHEIAQWMNSLGVAAFICDYRHRGKGYGHPAPLQDAQRAIRTVRARAKTLGVDPEQIGIIGFSAGGHLASTAATHFDDGDEKAEDPIDRVGCRPNFAILCYPVIAFDEPFTHYGSQRNLIGADADPKLVKSLSNEKQVTSKTPPTFLWHTNEDRGVPPENSVQFYLALVKAKVPAELHIYENGRHGLGLAKSTPAVSSWPKRCEDWLRGRGILKNQAND
jgi:acetyl esterase/lipase